MKFSSIIKTKVFRFVSYHDTNISYLLKVNCYYFSKLSLFFNYKILLNLNYAPDLIGPAGYITSDDN